MGNGRKHAGIACIVLKVTTVILRDCVRSCSVMMRTTCGMNVFFVLPRHTYAETKLKSFRTKVVASVGLSTWSDEMILVGGPRGHGQNSW